MTLNMVYSILRPVMLMGAYRGLLGPIGMLKIAPGDTRSGKDPTCLGRGSRHQNAGVAASNMGVP